MTAPAGDGHTDPPSASRRAGTVVALLALAASAVYGGDLFGVRTQLSGQEPPPARAPAVSRVATEVDPAAAEAERTRVRSAPWWQTVTTMAGTDDDTATVELDDAALQWRVAWSCTSGELEVTPVPATGTTDGGGSAPLVAATCPGEGTATSTALDATTLDIRADGPWELHLEQQLDVPLVEPPLPEMTADGAVELATGSFYDVDQTGRGTVTIHRLADGRHALRLDGFFVTPNIDLEIRLSPVEEPRTTAAHRAEPSVLVAGLDATTGSMNFLLPDDIDPTAYRSVVIWCPPVQNTYAAAALAPPA